MQDQYNYMKDMKFYNEKTNKYDPPAVFEGKPFVPSDRIRKNCTYLPEGDECEKDKLCKDCRHHPNSKKEKLEEKANQII